MAAISESSEDPVSQRNLLLNHFVDVAVQGYGGWLHKAREVGATAF